MSEKINFSIESSLLSDHPEDSVSGQITRALKLASENLDDFIRYTRAINAQTIPASDHPIPSDLILNGKLRYNVSTESAGATIFCAKGAQARLKNGCLMVGSITIMLDAQTCLLWHEDENDFNGDSSCILVTKKGARNDV